MEEIESDEEQKIKAFRFDHYKWMDSWNQRYNNNELPSDQKVKKLKSLLGIINKSTEKVCETMSFVAFEKLPDHSTVDKDYELDKNEIQDSVKKNKNLFLRTTDFDNAHC